MGWGEFLTAFGGVLTALGGWKLAEVFIFRRAKGRTMEAEADSAETQSKVDEFHRLQEQLKFAQEQCVSMQQMMLQNQEAHQAQLASKDEQLAKKDEQLKQKEERFQEQTMVVRQLNKDLVDKTVAIGTLQAENAELKAERKLKLCERRGCAKRQPQSGY